MRMLPIAVALGLLVMARVLAAGQSAKMEGRDHVTGPAAHSAQSAKMHAGTDSTGSTSSSRRQVSSHSALSSRGDWSRRAAGTSAPRDCSGGSALGQRVHDVHVAQHSAKLLQLNAGGTTAGRASGHS